MPRLFRFATDEDSLRSEGKLIPTDYELCARDADDGFEKQEQVYLRQKLPSVWRDWREMGALKFALLEDIPEPVPSKDRPKLTSSKDGSEATVPNDRPPIIAFAIVISLREDFVHEAIANPTPHLAVRVVQQHLDGKSPVLTLEEIAAANASTERELNLFVVHYTERFPARYNDDAKEDTRNSMMQKLLETHRGLHLRRMLYEVLGASRT